VFTAQSLITDDNLTGLAIVFVVVGALIRLGGLG